jgi:hypothetical protein
MVLNIYSTVCHESKLSQIFPLLDIVKSLKFWHSKRDSRLRRSLQIREEEEEEESNMSERRQKSRTPTSSITSSSSKITVGGSGS